MSALTAALATKIAAVLLAAGVTVTGATAAVAYTGTLPDSLQQSAHVLIGAPAPTTETETEPDDIADTETEDVADTGTPGDEDVADPAATRGPDATGSAAYGLCNAYAHGGLNETSTAYAALETTAGGADAITDYCATIPAHGKSAKHAKDPTETATPSPTEEPTDASADSKDKKPKNEAGQSNQGSKSDKPHKNK